MFQNFVNRFQSLLIKLNSKFLQGTLKEAFMYGVIGVVNTFIGMGSCLLLTYLGLFPELANLLGNIAGMLNSYMLNKRFTFKSSNSHKRDFLRFSLAMGMAYIFNLAALVIAHRIIGIDVYVSQILAAICYTISGFIISKVWVFR